MGMMSMSVMRTTAAAVMVLCLSNGSLMADEVPDRFGLLTPLGEGVEAGVTLVWQTSGQDQAKDELSASFDLLIGQQILGGTVFLYLEGSTAPDESGVSSYFPDANGDLGSALNEDGEARLQISEFLYHHPVWPGKLSVGLLNPAAGLDQSEIANDESTQFLAAPLVNNPTIGFPDYALGVIFHDDAERISLVATSSHGLADNPSASYSELIEVGEAGKGVFLGVEAYAQTQPLGWRLGAWLNSADHPLLSDESETDVNYGVYTVLEGDMAPLRWSTRLGAANPEVSESAWFASFALETSLPWGVGGLGLAYTGFSHELAGGQGDPWLVEAYLRSSLMRGVELSPVIQYHGLSDATGEGLSDGWVGAVRFTLAF
jgi:hypothetical protein